MNYALRSVRVCEDFVDRILVAPVLGDHSGILAFKSCGLERLIHCHHLTGGQRQLWTFVLRSGELFCYHWTQSNYFLLFDTR